MSETWRVLQDKLPDANAAQNALFPYFNDVLSSASRPVWPWRALTSKRRKGVYLYGAVGRGKTYLMDAVFEMAPHRKLRVHQHELLREISKRLFAARTAKRPIEKVARDLAGAYDIMFIDDVHLNDIATGKLLQGVCMRWLAEGVTLCMTSNYAPSHLLNIPGYQLKIKAFLAAIEASLHCVELLGSTDYRERTNVRRQHTMAELAAYPVARDDETTIMLEGHAVLGRYIKPGTLLVRLSTLCGAALSYRQYLALTGYIESLWLYEAEMTLLADASALQRFVWLVDVLYDEGVRLRIFGDRLLERLNACVADTTDSHDYADMARLMSRLQQMLA